MKTKYVLKYRTKQTMHVKICITTRPMAVGRRADL